MNQRQNSFPGLPLAGLTALVCGASRGIGRASAQALAAQGARVVLLARQQGALEDLCAALPAPAQVTADPFWKHEFIAADLGNLEQVRFQLNKFFQRHEAPINILINNTSGPKAGPLVNLLSEPGSSASGSDAAGFQEAFTQHILSAQVLVSLLADGMAKARYGRIINVLSTSVRSPIALLGVSNTIRAAMAGWAKTLSNELAPHGITVNNILPGYTETERLTELAQDRAQRTGTTEAAVKLAWLKAVPMGRFAAPEEVAQAICFFAGPGAAYVTGQSLAVDGGRTNVI